MCVDRIILKSFGLDYLPYRFHVAVRDFADTAILQQENVCKDAVAMTTLMRRVLTDVRQEDSGNYTCEVRGPQSVVLGHVTHFILVRGIFCSPIHAFRVRLDDVVVRALDLRSAGRWFAFSGSDRGWTIHSHTCVSVTKQYNLVSGRRCSAAGKLR